MMNKSKIDWCDFSWNPVTGCRHGCPYCYAAKQTKRFSGDVRLNKASKQLRKDENGLYVLDNPFRNQSGKVIPDPVGFEPIMHRYRLEMPAQKKKPANVFVCSMADLFGVWVPDSWIKEVFSACDAAPWHTYMFLTKNPHRYMELAEKGIIRTGDNFWYGSTATTPETEFFWHDQLNTFVSIEPIKAPFPDVNEAENGLQKAKWIIIGAETGNQKGKTVPERSWIESIAKACKKAGIPLFMKDNLAYVWGKDLVREYPANMPHEEDKPIPHCLECEYHEEAERHYNERHGKTIMNHFCANGDEEKKAIPGRYVRTSPPWCPFRGKEG